MTTFWEIMTSAQAMFAMVLIIGLLIYIAFYKDSDPTHHHKSGKKH